MAGPSDKPKVTNVSFHYIKSPEFRVLHVDGAFGGITPRGYIHAAIYSERAALPKAAEQEFSATGPAGEHKITESRGGIVRDIAVDLIMDRGCAEELRDWLSIQLENLERMEASSIQEGKQR